MIDLLDYKLLSTWIIYLIFYLIMIMIINSYKTKEDFVYMPWNMSTRYYPSYDIRGDVYPNIYPWNYPIRYIFPYLTPNNYGADGKYITYTNQNSISNQKCKK